MTQIDISRSSTLIEGVLFPIPFIAMQIYMFWEAVNGRISSLVRGLPAGVPDWSKWLLLIALMIPTSYFCWRLTTLRLVTLIGDRLWIQSWTKTVNVPITRVATVYWTQKLEDGNTPEAVIVLREPTALGQEIRFEPRTPAAFELLCSKVPETSHQG